MDTMSDEVVALSYGARGREPRAATVMLRELVDLSRQFETQLAKQLAVNSTDLLAMEHLMGEGPMGPTTLARRLGLSTPAVTAVLDRLTARGHASRTPHPTDRRAVVVVPSPSSVGQAMATLTPMVDGIDRVLDSFTADEREVITAYLARVVDAYRANLPEGLGDDDGPDAA